MPCIIRQWRKGSREVKGGRDKYIGMFTSQARPWLLSLQHCVRALILFVCPTDFQQQDDQIHNADKMVSSGLSDEFPPGLPHRDMSEVEPQKDQPHPGMSS